jgi:hypothetical protein
VLGLAKLLHARFGKALNRKAEFPGGALVHASSRRLLADGHPFDNLSEG